MGGTGERRPLSLTWAGLLIAVFGPTLIYTDLWDGGHSVFKFSALLVGAGIALMALAQARALTPRPKPTVLDGVVTAYVAWALIATLLAPEPLLSFTGSRPYWDGFAASLSVGVAYLVARILLARNPSDGRRLATTAAFTALALAAALVPAYLGVPVFSSLVRSGRAGSLMGQPTFLAGFAVTWLPLLALASRTAWRSKRRGVQVHVLRWGGPAAALLLVATLSRSGWLSAAVALTLWAVFSAPSARMRFIRGGAALAFGAALVAGLILLRQGGDTIGTRAGAWSYAAQATLDQPLVGSGPATYVYTFLRLLTPAHYRLEPATVLLDPHNWYLNAASTMGVPGGLLALGIAGSALALVLRSRLRDGPALAAVCGATGYFVHCALTPNSIATFSGALVLLAVATASTSTVAADYEHSPGIHRVARLLAALVGAVLIISGVRTATAEVAHATALRTGSLAASQIANALAPEVSVYAVQHAHMLTRADQYDSAVNTLSAARTRLQRDPQLAIDAGGIVEGIALSTQDVHYEQLALSWLAEGVRSAPTTPRYRYVYILALVRRGDRESASHHLEILEGQYGPDDRYVDELRDLLDAE